MFGGRLKRLMFEYTDLLVEAVLDRLPTVEIIEVEEKDGRKMYVIRTEVFGDGIDIWLKSKEDTVKVIRRKLLN